MAHRTEHNPADDRDPATGVPQLEEPDPYQLVWMEELRELLRGPGIDLTNPEHVEHLFVDWCSRWHATPPAERWDPLPSLTALGVAVGDLLRAARPDLRWRVIAGCTPTTLVLADATGKPVASPLTDIASWWMDRELSGITVLLTRLSTTTPVPAARRALVAPDGPSRTRQRSIA